MIMPLCQGCKMATRSSFPERNCLRMGYRYSPPARSTLGTVARSDSTGRSTRGLLHLFVNFFIRRPVFATVCALLIVLAGAVVIPSLPISLYPQLAPPQVTV